MRSISDASISDAQFVAESSESCDDAIANAGDLVGGQSAVGGAHHHAEGHALFSFGEALTLVFADVFDGFRQLARETADFEFQRSRQFTRAGDDRQIESAGGETADEGCSGRWRALVPGAA